MAVVVRILNHTLVLVSAIVTAAELSEWAARKKRKRTILRGEGTLKMSPDVVANPSADAPRQTR